MQHERIAINFLPIKHIKIDPLRFMEYITIDVPSLDKTTVNSLGA